MTFPSLAIRAWRGLAAAALCASLLSACGGSTSQVDTFIPARLVVFGDEYSALYDPQGTGNGANYAMNGWNATDSVLSCAANPIWTQRLAADYTSRGLARIVFKECNPDKLDSSLLNGYMQAKYGATVRAVVGQVDDFEANIAHDGLGSKDLVTLMVGLHDLIELYSDNLTFVSEDQKLAEAEARGRILAAQANRMAGLGAKVLVAQQIDLGLTPFGVGEGSSEAKLLTKLTDAFNKGIRLDLINDGSKIGLLAFDDTVRAAMKNSGTAGTVIACDADHVEFVSTVDDNSDNYIDGGGRLQGCTTATLSEDGATAYYWADSLHANAKVLHQSFGDLAFTRARNNPF